MFSSREIAAITLCSALWGVLNTILSPLFFTMTRLPFCCDLIGFTCLIIAVWWTRKTGTATCVGIIATTINFILRPGHMHFLGFTVASVLFDVTTRLVGYNTCFSGSRSGGIALVELSTLSGIVAGLIIGSVFMAPGIIGNVYGNVLIFAGLHAIGGVLGGTLGLTLTRTLAKHWLPLRKAESQGDARDESHDPVRRRGSPGIAMTHLAFFDDQPGCDRNRRAVGTARHLGENGFRIIYFI